MKELLKCELCPRKCKVNRYKNVGFCKANYKLKIALVSNHMWEEPCISGKNGSGTIFFSNCSLKCIYCQNYKIRDGYGKYISIKRFSQICLEQEKRGVNNINLVTPTHYVPHIIKGIKKARENGLSIPIVYNTSGYENTSTIEMLKDTVDIYLTDFKYCDNLYSKKYSNVDNYFEIACDALDAMYRQVGNPVFEDEIMKKGIIVRVLLLPGLLEDAKKIVNYVYSKYKDNVYLSLMNQYTPVIIQRYSELNRKITESEYNELIDYAYNIGVRNAFIQEGETALESFIPNFDKRGV